MKASAVEERRRGGVKVRVKGRRKDEEMKERNIGELTFVNSG